MRSGLTMGAFKLKKSVESKNVLSQQADPNFFKLSDNLLLLKFLFYFWLK